MNRLPSVSIIIPTLNSARTIERCLASIEKLEYPADKIETIVVDHGSSDETGEIILRHAARYESNPSARTISELRNFGVARSVGQVVAFLDSDCVVSPDWLINAIGVLNESATNITGAEYRTREKPNWLERHWYEHRSNSSLKSAPVLPAGNLLMWKETFLAVGGFDEDFGTCEDIDICLRLEESGYRIISNGSINVIHLGEARNVGEFFRKEIWHGSAMLKLLSRYRRFNPLKIPLISLFYLSITLLSVILLALDKHIPAVAALVTLIVVIPLVLGITETIRKGHSNFLVISFLYLIYLLARMVSIIRYNQIFKECVSLLKPRGGK